MLLRVGKQVIQFLVGAIRSDIHPNANLLVARGYGVVEPEQAANIEAAFKFGR